MPDIAEDEIVSTLTYVVAQHRKGGSHTSRDDTAMQVDSEASSNIPSLPTFLSSCVLYNTSPAALRVAIRKHLSDVDDIICLLEVLDDWIAGWNTITLKLLPAGVVKNQKGIFVPKLHSAKIDTPQLGKVLVFQFGYLPHAHNSSLGSLVFTNNAGCIIFIIIAASVRAQFTPPNVFNT